MIVLLLALLSADPRPLRLSPTDDPVGSWREVKLTTTATSFIGRVIMFSDITDRPIVVRGVTLPRYVWLRKRGEGEPVRFNNPIFQSVPALSWATLELTYDDHPPFLLEREFIIGEDNLPDVVEIDREVKRRTNSGTLWPAERFTGGSVVLNTGEVLDDRSSPTLDPTTVTRVSWRAIVDDHEATEDQRGRVRLAASRVEAAMVLNYPESGIAAGEIEAAIVREVVLPRYSKVAGKGSAEKTQ